MKIISLEKNAECYLMGKPKDYYMYDIYFNLMEKYILPNDKLTVYYDISSVEETLLRISSMLENANVLKPNKKEKQLPNFHNVSNDLEFMILQYTTLALFYSFKYSKLYTYEIFTKKDSISKYNSGYSLNTKIFSEKEPISVLKEYFLKYDVYFNDGVCIFLDSNNIEIQNMLFDELNIFFHQEFINSDNSLTKLKKHMLDVESENISELDNKNYLSIEEYINEHRDSPSECSYFLSIICKLPYKLTTKFPPNDYQPIYYAIYRTAKINPFLNPTKSIKSSEIQNFYCICSEPLGIQ